MSVFFIIHFFIKKIKYFSISNFANFFQTNHGCRSIQLYLQTADDRDKGDGKLSQSKSHNRRDRDCDDDDESFIRFLVANIKAFAATG